MAHLLSEGEVIDMTLDALWQPQAFIWNSQCFLIRHISERWLVQTDFWSEQGEVSREYVKLTAWNERAKSEVLCEVYLDLIEEVWFLSCVYD
jgi:hypothetical protein